MPKIMVVGSSNTDMVVKAVRLPAPGETVTGGEFISAAGGKGANQAVAVARLGAEVIFVARIGNDLLGDAALSGLAREGISTEFIVRDAERPSGVALIFVDESGENMIAVAPGANAALSPADVDAASGALGGCDALIVQLEVPLDAVERAIHLAKGNDVRVILNPAPARPIPAGLLAMADVLTPNESETRLLLGLRESEPAGEPSVIRRLVDAGCGAVILTMGSKGALIVTDADTGSVHVPARVVDAVDATGAGDAFTGALGVALSSGMDIVAAGQFACAAAAVSVTRLGAQPSMPTRAEVEALSG